MDKCTKEKLYTKDCDMVNKDQLNYELKNYNSLEKNRDALEHLYPDLDDPYFNIKIADKKEFDDTKYDGNIDDIEKYSKELSNSDFELAPQQAFVRNFLSFQTPYNSLLLFHGLGSGKTCSAIGVCEEMRDYLKQMGLVKKIIIVASPNVQDNFRLQLFDERKLKEVDGFWTMKGCLGNKFLKEINPTGMKGLTKQKIIYLVKTLINAHYHFVGYLEFSNEIKKISGNETDSKELQIKRLQNEYEGSLIVIDEVHNIRITDDNNKNDVAKNLMFLVTVVDNIRLLLLSATPMFNSYKEIVWILNLMNMNDRRAMVSISDIFNANGEFKTKQDEDVGKQLFMRKSNGYISYVRGENPYTFPFRVYPDVFAPDNVIDVSDYPKYQLNGMKILDNKKISKLKLFLLDIGEYQQYGYKYIIDKLRNRKKTVKQMRTGKTRNVPAFSTLQNFGYTDLQMPLQALNIIYPYEGLDEYARTIQNIEYVDEFEEENIDALYENIDETKDSDVIDEVMRLGPSVNIPEQEEREPEEREPEVQTIQKIKKKSKTKETKLKEKEQEQEVLPKEVTKEVAPKRKKFSSIVTNKGHNIEGMTVSNYPSLNNMGVEEKLLPENIYKGGVRSESELEPKPVMIDPNINVKELTGTEGLQRMMTYKDTKTPAVKGDFAYKREVEHIFKPQNIGKYSSKIKNICECIYNSTTDRVSEGIILIYSEFIDAGLIPMSLALEEMGMTRFSANKASSLFKTPPTPICDVRTMKPPTNKKDFRPAQYAMITGDKRLSPDNDKDMKNITSNENGEGNIIKVVLISQAGSEGLDFKGIRQIHILEPWYNVNRIEQIIGRGVRNFSHKDLPFNKRNVQIFLYGTKLPYSEEEESTDLYIYRIAEIKAIKIGKVTRLMKQISVDCNVHYGQTQLTNENFMKINANKNIKQELSTFVQKDHFLVGDTPNTSICDYMDSCTYKCLPELEEEETKLPNFDTYNEKFITINSDKLIQKIKNLMRIRFFYKKKDLIQLINNPKEYPLSQIYSALTQIINDNTEYIVDKYDRTGYLINIGDYYLFQPSELNYKNISIYDRSVPINFKHDELKIPIKSNISKPVPKKHIRYDNVSPQVEKVKITLPGKQIFYEIFSNYKNCLTLNETLDKNNWHLLCYIVAEKMKNIDKLDIKVLDVCIIEHITDTLMLETKIHLYNYIFNENIDLMDDMGMGDDQYLTHFIQILKEYLTSKMMNNSGVTGIVLFDGPSRINNLHIYVSKEGQWEPAKPSEIEKLQPAINKKYGNLLQLQQYVGFIGFETNLKYMVYKVKDTLNPKSNTGFRCDQAGKNKVIMLLNEIENDVNYAPKITKDSALELCVRQELTLRYF